MLATFALMFLAGPRVFAWQQAANEPSPNAVDIGFADDMRTHHLQGVTMALSYLKDGTDPTFLQMANEIVLVQAGESRLLSQYLEDWGSPDLDLDTAMGWMDMAPVPQTEQPGMATDAELAELDAAEGQELDDLFSSLDDQAPPGRHPHGPVRRRPRLGGVHHQPGAGDRDHPGVRDRRDEPPPGGSRPAAGLIYGSLPRSGRSGSGVPQVSAQGTTPAQTGRSMSSGSSIGPPERALADASSTSRRSTAVWRSSMSDGARPRPSGRVGGAR